MPQTIELEDVVAAAFDEALHGIWTSMPGIIQSYDATTQTASVQLGVKNRHVGESGDQEVETITVLPSVPVVHLGGSGFRAVFPPTRGDTALVVFCSRSIAEWLRSGGVVDPGTDHHHDISDGVVFVGFRPRPNALSSSPADHPSIGKDGGATIEFHDSEIRVGGDVGAQPSFHGPDLITALQAVLSVIATAIGEIPGGATAGTTITTAVSDFVTAAPATLTTMAKLV
jgi:hypothetical protein